MFDIGWGELVVIGIAALIFIGPKELPGVLRTLGQWLAKIRRMAGEFQNQFQEAMREAELSELRKEVDDMAAHAANYSNFDPLGDVRKEIENTGREIDSAMTGKPTDPPAAGAPPPVTPPAAAASSDLIPAAEPMPKAETPAPEPAREPAKHDAGGSAPT